MALRMFLKRRDVWIAAPMLFWLQIAAPAQSGYGSVRDNPDALRDLMPPPVDPDARFEDEPLQNDEEREQRARERIDAVEDVDTGPRDSRKPILDRKPVPWKNEAGQRLVGVVENRQLTENEMRRRANMLLALAPKLEPDASARQAYADDEEKLAELQQQMMEDRRMTYESGVLKDWIQVTTLAVHAEKSGIQVSDQEVQQALAELSNLSGTQGDQQQKGLSLIGVAEADLQREVRDSVLVEKLLDRTLAETISEQKKRAIFADNPAFFLPPDRVRAWQLFLPQVGRMTSDQAARTTKQMKAIGKLMRKTKVADDAALEALRLHIKAEFPTTQEYVLSDLGWVEEGQTIPAAKVLFDTEPGDVSEVIQTNVGLMLVRVFERSEGGNTFEEALPQINSALHGQLKDLLYEKVKRNYDVHSGASGLNRMVAKDASEMARQRPLAQAPAPAVVAPEPDLGSLRRVPPPVEPEMPQSDGGARVQFSDPPPLLP